MDGVVVETVLETVVCLGIGWALAIVVSRRRAKRGAEPNGWPIGDALAFVGGAFGILLGLLLVFATEHYADTRHVARDEAVNAAALYDAVSAFPAKQTAEARRVIYCTMDSLRTDDWVAGAELDVTGSENTSVWLGNLQDMTEQLDQSSDAAASMHYFINENMLDLNKNRQRRLMLSLPEIPSAVWWVLAISGLIFTYLLAMHMGPTSKLAIMSIIATAVVLCSIAGALAALDYPFTGRIGTLNPVALDSSIRAIQDKYPNEDFSACPRLATPVYE